MLGVQPAEIMFMPSNHGKRENMSVIQLVRIVDFKEDQARGVKKSIGRLNVQGVGEGELKAEHERNSCNC